MRTLTTMLFVTAFVLNCAGPVRYQAKSSALNAEQLLQAGLRFHQSLQISNDGVQLSAMMQVVKMKLQFPEQDFSRLRADVADLLLNSSSEEVRSGAFLTSICLDNPNAIFVSADLLQANDHQEFYFRLSEQFNRYLAVTSSRQLNADR